MCWRIIAWNAVCSELWHWRHVGISWVNTSSLSCLSWTALLYCFHCWIKSCLVTGIAHNKSQHFGSFFYETELKIKTKTAAHYRYRYTMLLHGAPVPVCFCYTSRLEVLFDQRWYSHNQWLFEWLLSFCGLGPFWSLCPLTSTRIYPPHKCCSVFWGIILCRA